MISNFRLGSLIQTGGQSKVYCADQLDTGEKVAIKVIRAANIREWKPHVEVELHAGLAHHPHIIGVRTSLINDNDGDLWMVLDYAPGGDLLDMVTGGGGQGCDEFDDCSYSDGNSNSNSDGDSDDGDEGIDQATARPILRQVADALAHCHSSGILHGDIKSDNILIDASGGAQLADFGCARRVGEVFGKRHGGTVSKMPPEVLHWNCYERMDGATEEDVSKIDVWSFGIMMYEVLTGHCVFNCSNRGDLSNQMRAKSMITKGAYVSPRALAPTISDEAVDLIGMLIVVDPSKRPSMKEVLDHPFFSVEQH
jgi:serine/threonine protein kinase